VEFPVGELLWKLTLTIFAPLLVGKALREVNSSLNPQPSTQNPKPDIRNPKPET
jgi:hypothetical protein